MDPVTLEQVIEQLGQRRADALSTLELLAGYREQIERERAALENPQAVSDYLAFFVDFVSRAAAECERIAAALPGGIQTADIDSLRQLAANSSVEQRRCLLFRDKCINKPLPHERMRPLLNEISITTRDQLTAFRDLTRAADRLVSLMPPAPPAPPPKRGLDRRELFTRLFKH
jgi:hypothetical protein